jgi:hypothetical protein
LQCVAKTGPEMPFDQCSLVVGIFDSGRELLGVLNSECPAPAAVSQAIATLEGTTGSTRLSWSA